MCQVLRTAEPKGDGKKLKRDKTRQLAFRLAMIAGRLDVDRMLSEMSPHQLEEWEAALEFVGVDIQQRSLARLTREMHVLLERFSGHENDASLSAAVASLPTVREFMRLYTFDEHAQRLPFQIQTQDEIINTLNQIR